MIYMVEQLYAPIAVLMLFFKRLRMDPIRLMKSC